MNRTITFNELRKIKDSLPAGSMHRIADELNLSVETVRNFFGGFVTFAANSEMFCLWK